MDIALAIELLVPGAEYRGSLTEDTVNRHFNGDQKAAYESIVWTDERAKPSWPEVKVQEPTVNNLIDVFAKREKASADILEIAQIWQQLNMAARVLELINKKFDLANDPNFDVEERQEMQQILATWLEIKAIRDASNE